MIFNSQKTTREGQYVNLLSACKQQKSIEKFGALHNWTS